ncbi:MAG: S1/P1 nuclease [Alcanivoracaceae bacterium]|nr:S1/P1 nuclease [Alcanivoracaceae bacterium]
MKKINILLLILFQANVSLAWNAAGHQLMAAITWDLLDEKQQSYWVDILKHHPRFAKDFKNNIPKHVKFNPSTYNEWIFRQAAIWPDLARGFQKNLQDKYHHGSWHYINYPLYLDKKIDTSFLNLNTNFKNSFHNNLNITQALKGNLAVLSKQGATKKEKALALSWILHLVGDSHQPLHSTALFSENYFSKGDRGGNLINIDGQGYIKNLHWYWDSRLDNSTSFKIIDLKAKKIGKKYNKIALKNQKKPINQWLNNANKLAKKYVYTPVLMGLLRDKEQQQNPQPTIYISNSYDKQARFVAEQQIAKAAFQLSHILEMIK